MNRFGVSEDKAHALTERFAVLGVHEDDLEESFIRASGPGGQHVNKVATCVRLRHRPTGTEVRSQAERSQALNRYRARVRLAEKLEKRILDKETEAEKERAKIRRRKRQRSKRAKKKILDEKRRRARAKELRRKPEAEEE